VVPKQHFPIFEQVPDKIVSKLFNISNKISTALFETLNIQGTNIFVTNGVSAGQSVAHFVINIIPRKEKDGINLQWTPRQLSEEEMSTVEIAVKDAAKNVGIQTEKKEEKKPIKREAVSFDEQNYLWKSVNKKIS
jgi:histidine triad (HIT) family protein